MTVQTNTLQKIMITSGLITQKRFDDLVAVSEKRGVPIEQLLLDEGVIDPNKLLEIKGDLMGVKTIDLRNLKITHDVLGLIPEPIARRHNVIAFAKKNNELHLAMADPDDLQIREFIKKTSGMEVKPFLTTHESIDIGLSLYHSNIEEEFKKILGKENFGEDLKGVSPADLNAKLASIAEQIPVVRIVDTLLDYAIFEKASDIHIEPDENRVVVRYRIDGILHEVMSLPKIVLSAVVARVKVLSNLKIDEHRLPQDGRFKKQIGENKISFRVSTIPIFDGEKVVLRLLDETAKAMTLPELGLSDKKLDIVMRNIKRPHGAILVTGPTGSGKSTTLYSILTMLNTREVNISTIEDPVEYRIVGVNQMQVSPKIGLTFAIGLRALLRQDPNIIMIGEIRDLETAEEAAHAAMTGHLVLSTLHTNSAAGALPRLLDMNVEPFLISSTINLIIAQRLVRRICQDCKKKFKLDKKTLASLDKDFDLKRLLDVMKQAGAISSRATDISQVEFFQGEGCDKCGHTGYKGRLGIYEVLVMTPEVIKLVLGKASSNDIEAQAISVGMVLMWQDGFIKAHQGLTTIEEVLRVSRE